MKKYVRSNKSDDVYIVVLDSAGFVESTSVVDSSIAKTAANQLRSGGRKVKMFRDYDEYVKFIDSNYEERKYQSKLSRVVTASTDSRDYSENAIKREIEDLAYDLGVAVDFHEEGKYGGHPRYLVDVGFDVYDGADLIDTCGVLIRDDEPSAYVLYKNLRDSYKCRSVDKAIEFLEFYIRKLI